jgi:protein SCO1
VRGWTRALFFSLLIATTLSTACRNAASKLPTYSTVPRFTMTDSEGHAFDSSVLLGKVWLADFIYTSCPGPCPRMTSEMHTVHRRVSGDNDVRLVSISVDPEHDSPPVLNDFAHRFGGPAEDWVFLTGTPRTVHLLAFEVFHVGDVIANMDHSTKFILVDKRGVIRGYYSSLDADGIKAMLHDMAALRKEAS